MFTLHKLTFWNNNFIFHHLWKQSVNNLLQSAVTCGEKSAKGGEQSEA